MAYILTHAEFDTVLQRLKQDYILIGPVRKKNKGKFSDADLITYGQIESLSDLETNGKSQFSAKETIFPPSQTLFYFTEDEYREPKFEPQKQIVFLRACDFNAIKRLDLLFLENGQFVDAYYKRLREKTHFFVFGCEKSYENCFCVSLGTNQCEGYDAFLNFKGEKINLFPSEPFKRYFAGYEENEDILPQFIERNHIQVDIPEGLSTKIYDHPYWDQYGKRCIGCGRCNFSCPTCTCFTMQDIFYRDNKNAGERRRVWASCQVDGFTDMAGGHSYRKQQGERMRFKVMHKIHDFSKRFNMHMCVGCGRCDDVCPEYISFSQCISGLKGVVAHDN